MRKHFVQVENNYRYTYFPEPEVFPIAYYHHNETGGRGCIISGHMYSGCEFPDFRGWFFFGDFRDG